MNKADPYIRLMAKQVTGGDPDRIEREQAFHDVRFAEDTEERSADRFYALIGPSDSHFQAKLDDIAAGDRALELGCGLEMHYWELADRGVDVTAIDISQVAIDQASAKAESRGLDPSKFLRMNAEQLEFPDDTFDVVYGNGILHHLDLDRSLSEISRVLKPGGRMLFVEPSGHNPVINLYRRLTPSQRTEDEHPLMMSDLDLMRRYFSDVDAAHFHFTSLAALGLLKTKAFNPTADRLERLDQKMFERFPYTQRFGWMIVLDATTPSSTST